MSSSSRDAAHGFAIDAIMDAKDHKGRALAAQRAGDHGRAADEYAAAADAWRAAAAALRHYGREGMANGCENSACISRRNAARQRMAAADAAAIIAGGAA